MGLLDHLSGSSSSESAKAAGGLLQEIEGRSGGIGGMLAAFHQNGMGGLVQQWAGGQTNPANPVDVEAGLAGTGLIDSVAQRTGLSPMAVKAGLAVAVPLVIHHMVANGHVTPQGEATDRPVDHGSVLQSVLGHLL